MILIADDTVTNVFVLEAMLRSFGCLCRTAADGVEAVEIVRIEVPALILMDINMPNLDGMEAARMIRERHAGRSIPIVAITAYPESRHLERFKAARFDDLLVKPIDLDRLRETVQRYAA